MSANLNPWQTTPPTEPGRWEMRSDETEQEPHTVTIFSRAGELWVRDVNVGTNTLERYHFNLCSIRWRRVPLQPDQERTLAESAYGDLLLMPLPRTEQDFRRAIVMAVLIGRQIEADFQQQ